MLTTASAECELVAVVVHAPLADAVALTLLDNDFFGVLRQRCLRGEFLCVVASITRAMLVPACSLVVTAPEKQPPLVGAYARLSKKSRAELVRECVAAAPPS